MIKSRIIMTGATGKTGSVVVTPQLCFFVRIAFSESHSSTRRRNFLTAVRPLPGLRS